MARSIQHLENIFNMNSRLFINAMEGVTDAQANERVSDNNNPFIWIATHTVWARFNACAMLGKPAEKNPYDGMFENFRAFNHEDKYPSLSEIKAEWNKASDLLKEALAQVTEDHLASDCPLKSPIGDFSFAGTVAFLAQHESYDLGQMAFIKKLLTKEAMKYN
mgnify:CR=1 FL=1